MWATMGGDISPATLASVEREVFAHDPDWDGLSLREIPRQIDRLPETSKITSAERRPSGVDKVHWVCRFDIHYEDSSCSSAASSPWRGTLSANLPAWNRPDLIIGRRERGRTLAIPCLEKVFISIPNTDAPEQDTHEPNRLDR